MFDLLPFKRRGADFDPAQGGGDTKEGDPN